MCIFAHLVFRYKNITFVYCWKFSFVFLELRTCIGFTIEFSAPQYTTVESSGVLQAALITSLPLNLDYQVRVKFSPGTASSKYSNSHEYLVYLIFIEHHDFTDSPLTVTVPAGKTRVNFSVPVTVDSIFEDTETFIMILQTLSSVMALGVEIGTQGTAVGQIIDDTGT